jgi:hypothetical protein
MPTDNIDTLAADAPRAPFEEVRDDFLQRYRASGYGPLKPGVRGAASSMLIHPECPKDWIDTLAALADASIPSYRG